MSGKNLENINYLEGLYVYGSGELDQFKPLNDNVKEENQIFQTAIPRKIPLNFINPTENIKSVKCGIAATFILSNEGNVYSFGLADEGGIGHEDSYPVKRIPLKFQAEGISGGDSHGIAYNKNNLAFWGHFKSSKKWLGKACYEPTYFNNMHINGELYKKAISGTNHVIILTQQKNVYSFGCNEFGQTGVSPSRIFHHFQINKLYEKNVEDIFTGDEHSFLTKYEGDIKILKSWGCNGNGQLGIGSYATKVNENYSIYVPTKVVFPGISKISVKKVAGGNSTSICLTDDNRIFVWGLNDSSQLGLGSKEKIIPRPKELQFFNPKANPNNIINEIYARNEFFYAKNNSSNKVYSWGVGDCFVLGNRKEKPENSPYLINHLFFKNLNVTDLSLGTMHVAVYLTEKEEINKNRSRSTSQKKSKKNETDKNKSNSGSNNKPIKRKNENIPEEKNKKIEEKEIIVKIKEEYITLKESDQPKSTAKKIYKKIINNDDNEDDNNKIMEEKKEKPGKKENNISKAQHKINLENDFKKNSKKRQTTSKKEKEIDIEYEEKKSKSNNRKKSNSKIESKKNDNKNKDNQSKSQKRKNNSKNEEKNEKIDIEKDVKEEKKEKTPSKNKARKSNSKTEIESKEEIQKEKDISGKNTPKNKSKTKMSLSNKQKEEEGKENENIEEEKKEKVTRKSSRNKNKKKEDEEEKQNDRKSKRNKKTKEENEESDNDENSENNSGRKYSYPKKVKTPDKNQGKNSRSKQGNGKDKSQRKSKSKSKERYPKKK